jgi:hypothetical protein
MQAFMYLIAVGTGGIKPCVSTVRLQATPTCCSARCALLCHLRSGVL